MPSRIVRLFFLLFAFATGPAGAEPLAFVGTAAPAVVVVDLATMREVDRIVGLPGTPYLGAFHPWGTRLYASYDAGILVIDPAAKAVVTDIRRSNVAGLAVQADGSRMFASFGDLAFAFDTGTNASLGGAILLGGGPWGIALAPDGSRLYVAASRHDEIAIFDGVRYAKIGRVLLPGVQPAHIALDAVRNRLYVAGLSGNIVVVDLASNQVVATLPGAAYPNAIALDEAGTRLYVTDGGVTAGDGRGAVIVIDTTRDVLLRRIDIPQSSMRGIVVDEAGQRVYAVDGMRNLLLAIDPVSHQIVGSAGVGVSPTFVAMAPASPLLAVEYFHEAFGHYFATAAAAEVAALDSGRFAGWTRTGRSFRVFPPGASGTQDVCRFFSATFAPRSSHFYTPSAPECAQLRAGTTWTFEGYVFAFAPAGSTGQCAGGSVPLFRLYNDGRSGAPNHRYTIDATVRAAMVSAGWVPEGNGQLGVIGCVLAP